MKQEEEEEKKRRRKKTLKCFINFVKIDFSKTRKKKSRHNKNEKNH